MKLSARTALHYIVFAFLFTSACMLFGRFAIRYAIREVTHVSADTNAPVFCIDPGHGGMDGGASQGDITEKDLNLTVARNLADICSIFGQNAILTRNTDTLLYDVYHDLEDYTGKKKTYDLRNRLRIAEESGASLTISIHMNKFPREQYKGLQVYHTVNAEHADNAARMIQNYTKTYLMPWNERKVKAASSDIYLLHRIKQPAVLVECGFLSNPEECQLLTEQQYQAKLASVIFAASSEWQASLFSLAK